MSGIKGQPKSWHQLKYGKTFDNDSGASPANIKRPKNWKDAERAIKCGWTPRNIRGLCNLEYTEIQRLAVKIGYPYQATKRLDINSRFWQNKDDIIRY